MPKTQVGKMSHKLKLHPGKISEYQGQRENLNLHERKADRAQEKREGGMEREKEERERERPHSY